MRAPPSGVTRTLGGPPPRVGFGGSGGFAVAHSKSGLSYLAERYDPSSISDAHAVVAFKNLLKKDSTTKARALDDLVAYVDAHPHERQGGAEEAVLDAWVKFYPRLSIDESRKVRELAHTLQAKLLVSARKRMEKRIPDTVGPWLAGTSDRDRGVAKAAADGLSWILSTPEKEHLFWKRLQSKVLVYATEALKETPMTLSDMRSVAKEEAEHKCFRVVYGSLSLVLSLLEKLAVTETDEQRDLYTAYFAADALWKGTTSPDNHVRRATFRLMAHCLTTRPSLLDGQLPRLTKLAAELDTHARQTGTAVDLVRLLTILTKTQPATWNQRETHPMTRLLPLLEKGTQGSPSTPDTDFWSEIDMLVATIPPRCIALDAAHTVLASFRAGITARETPRSSYVGAWIVYLSTVRRLLEQVAPVDMAALVTQNVYPLLDHYLFVSDTSAWMTGTELPVVTGASLLCARAAYPDVVQSFRDKWLALSRGFSERIAASLPAVSSAFRQSQADVAREGARWMDLVAETHASVQKATSQPDAPTNLIEDVMRQPSVDIVKGAVSVLAKRNYNPFGAAALIQAAFCEASHLLDEDDLAIVDALFPTGSDAEDHLLTLVKSPSATPLLSCLSVLAGRKDLQAKFAAITEGLVSQLLAEAEKEPEEANKHLGLIFSEFSGDALQRTIRIDALQQYLERACVRAVNGTPSSLGILETCMSLELLIGNGPVALLETVVDMLEAPFSDPKRAANVADLVVRGLAAAVTRDKSLNRRLLTGLLKLVECNDSQASQDAAELHSYVMLDLNKEGMTHVSIIHRHLEAASQESLSVKTIQKHRYAVEEKTRPDDYALLERLFLDPDAWIEQLKPFLADGVSPALAMTSAMGGAYMLIPGHEKAQARVTVGRDRTGRSSPARMAEYTASLVEARHFAHISEGLRQKTVLLLHLVVELSSDQLALLDRSSFWGDLTDAEVLADAEKAVTDVQQRLQAIEAQDEAFSRTLVNTMLRQAGACTPLGIYTARATSKVLQTMQTGRNFSVADEDLLNTIRAETATGPDQLLRVLAVLTGYGDRLAPSKMMATFCNQVMSEVASSSMQRTEQTLATLVLANACMAVYDDAGPLPVVSNRLVFTVKTVTSWFGSLDDDDGDETDRLDARIAAESCRALQRLLPAIRDMYGAHWEQSLRFCIRLWGRAAFGRDAPALRMPYMHASLKLVSILETMEEPNDDLEDALALVGPAQSEALLKLLTMPREGTVGQTQPQEMVDVLLCRMVGMLPLTHIKDLSALYGLLGSSSRAIQTAAFDLVHRALPTVQEAYSLDVILEKKEGQLPNELLELLADAPTLETFTEEELEMFPTALRAYLLAWQLVFDALRGASDKVRGQYATQLSRLGVVAQLLDFVVDVLGHTAAHALQLDKEGLSSEHIRQYDRVAADAEPTERNMHWLLVHLYYEVLRFLPGPFRAWYAACRAKQTRVAVEAWTARWFSGLLVADVLDEVEAWARQQQEQDDKADAAPANDDGPEMQFAVRVVRATREVVAAYTVDDQEASITIRLPDNYPLDAVAVAGVHRVAVSERKWQSWLMITQGVIMFSNGNVVEGLATFRRNVLGALEGQTECAICYSILATDMRLPDKECGTCHNLFHRACLYKWMDTSSQNTCPLCRNPINMADGRPRRA